MSKHVTKISWSRGNAVFDDGNYSRAHLWQFDGGIEVRASASPHVVPLPLSIETAVDPEEAFAAAISSCHMLWFLSLAAQEGYVVDSYEDSAEGALSANAEGPLAMTEITLRPQIRFQGERQPAPTELELLHDRAHSQCFLARSVKTQVHVERGG